MEHIDDQQVPLTNDLPPPAICVLQKSADHYWQSLEPVSAALQTSSTVIDETSSPSSSSITFPTSTSKLPSLIVIGQAIAPSKWLDLCVKEDQKRVCPPPDVIEKLLQDLELRSLVGPGANITKITVWTSPSIFGVSPKLSSLTPF